MKSARVVVLSHKYPIGYLHVKLVPDTLMIPTNNSRFIPMPADFIVHTMSRSIRGFLCRDVLNLKQSQA